MSYSEKGGLPSGVDESYSDSESEGYEVEVSSKEDPPAACDFRPYTDHEEENSGRYHGVPQRPRKFRNQVKRIYESLFTIRGFTCIILFASLVALALLLASRIILDKRPYSWRADRIDMVSGVISTAAIIILASFACAAINLLPATNHLLSTSFNIVVDVVLPIYLIQAGCGLFKDQQARWSYDARDWCANPNEGGCPRLVCVLGYLNDTAGHIALGIAFIHISLLLTRVIALSRQACWSKTIPPSRATLDAEELKFSSGV